MPFKDKEQADHFEKTYPTSDVATKAGIFIAQLIEEFGFSEQALEIFKYRENVWIVENGNECDFELAYRIAYFVENLKVIQE